MNELSEEMVGHKSPLTHQEWVKRVAQAPPYQHPGPNQFWLQRIAAETTPVNSDRETL